LDGYQLIAALFQSLVSLAWPAAVFGSVWLFRDKLRTLLPLLRMKYKDFDVSFRLEQAEKEAAQIPKPPPSPDLEPTPEEKSRFEKIAEHSPRAAILEKRAELEQVLRSVAEPYLTATSPRSWKTLALGSTIRILRKHGVLDERTSALLDDLRAVGNRAAHSADDSEFTFAEAIQFGKLTDEAISLVRMLE
jgi:hypothetical protein